VTTVTTVTTSADKKGTKDEDKRPKSKEKESKRGKGRSATPCPLDSKKFMELAKAIEITIGDRKITAQPKAFKTGSFGWNAGGPVAKGAFEVGEFKLNATISVNITIAGSKPSRKESKTDESKRARKKARKDVDEGEEADTAADGQDDG